MRIFKDRVLEKTVKETLDGYLDLLRGDDKIDHTYPNFVLKVGHDVMLETEKYIEEWTEEKMNAQG